MDKLSHYREVIRQTIELYASWGCSTEPDIVDEIVFDPVRDHYELRAIGWQGSSRVDHSVVHIDIIGDKVWLQRDGTNRPVADALVEGGIPKEDIVLAEHPPRSARTPATPSGDAMTERDKMLAGELYLAADPELTAMRVRARELVARLNALPPSAPSATATRCCATSSATPATEPSSSRRSSATTGRTSASAGPRTSTPGA